MHIPLKCLSILHRLRVTSCNRAADSESDENSMNYTHVLDNGLTLVAEQMPFVRSAAFRMLVPAGSVNDPEEKVGAAHALYGLCFRGAGTRNSREVSDALDSLGVQRGGGAGDELTSFGGVLLGDDLLQALDIYTDIVLRPHLPANQLAAEKALALQNLESLEENPMQKTMVELRKAHFPGPHGRNSLGTQESIESLTIDDLREAHETRFQPSGAILSVAGNFDWEVVRKRANALFGGWRGGGPAPVVPSTEGGTPLTHLDHPSNQEQIGVVYDSVAPDHKQYYEGLMAVQVLSGGMAARLFTEVREKRGLVYAVMASFQAVKHHGFVQCYAGTTPERSQETLDVLLSELRRLAEGVTQEEIDRGRTGLLSRLVMSGESTSSRAVAIASDYYLRGRVRSMEEIRAAVEAVTPDSVGEHLRAIPPANFTVLTLGPTALEAKGE